MKILHIETGRNLYGGGLQVLYLIRELSRPGISNVLVCPNGSDIAEKALPFTDHVRALEFRGECDPRLPAGIISSITETRPDIVHLHSRRGADLWGAVAARIKKVPFVVTRRVDNPEPGWLARFKYGRAARVVAISGCIGRILIDEGVMPEQIEYIHSAVDTEKYRPGCSRREWFLSEFGIPEGARTAGMVAQFIQRKGHATFIEAIPQIVREVPEARFIFFGRGPLREEIQKRVKDDGLDPYCIFPGFRNDLADIIPCLDLLVHPASMEGLGVALLQASSCGIPVVALRAGGIPEVIVDGYSGYLLSPSAPAGQLAARTAELLKDREKALEMGKNGRTYMEKNFTIKIMAEKYLELYSRIVTAHPHPERRLIIKKSSHVSHE